MVAYGRPTPFLASGQGCRPGKQHTLANPGSGVGVRAIGEAAEVVEPAGATTADLSYVSYQLNTWSARFERTGVSVLVDPWLCGELFFESVPWLFNAKKGMIVDGAIDVDAVAAETDVIIITQGLNDHCHRPTLKALDKNITVVASPTAAQVCRELGFRTVYGLEHGESVTILDGRLRVTGTAGALVGPPWSKRENGFVMEEVAEGGVRMFYECHCDFDEAFMRGVGQVDVVVTSTSSVYLSPTASKPIAYPVVSGNDNLVSLLKLLRPKVLLPLMYENGATQSETGPLAQLTFMEGRLADQPAKLQAAGLGDVRFISDFVPGERMYVSLNDA